jgi:hypothetical protein
MNTVLKKKFHNISIRHFGCILLQKAIEILAKTWICRGIAAQLIVRTNRESQAVDFTDFPLKKGRELVR